MVCQQSHVSRDPEGESLICLRDSESVLCLDPAPLATVREQSRPKDLVGYMLIYASKSASANLNLGCGNWNSPWTWFQHLSAMVHGQSCPPRVPPSDQAGVLPGTGQEPNPVRHLANRPNGLEHNCYSEADPCPEVTLLNKVLEVVPSIQGPDRIHACLSLW